MLAESPVREFLLSDGVKASIQDATRHYFGGYYLVTLLVIADVQLSPAWFATEQEYEDARRRLGRSARFIRKMEKMAVPLGEVEEVRRRLLDSFEANLLVYLSRPDFPRRFARSEYEKALKPAGSHRYGHR